LRTGRAPLPTLFHPGRRPAAGLFRAFDQSGVELGKKLVDRALLELHAKASVASHDSSTNALINRVNSRK
jgi:hypothetical protein